MARNQKTTAPELPALKAAVTDHQRADVLHQVQGAFDARVAHEMGLNPANASIQDKLKGARAKMTTNGRVTVLAALSVSPEFINRRINGDKRFNIYAIDKANDLLEALSSGFLRNAVNRAMLVSLMNCRDAGLPFTGATGLYAVSDKIKLKEPAYAPHLRRHTVSEATASTQSSSTLSALMVIGVVVNDGPVRAPLYRLTESAQTRALEALLRPAV